MALTLGAAAAVLALALPAAAETTVKCESKDGSRVSCAADTSKGVTLSKQLSTEGCWENESWGTDAKGIWVADHCRAEFTVNADAKKADKGGGKKKLLIGGAATAAVVTAIAVSGDDSDDDDNDRGTPTTATATSSVANRARTVARRATSGSTAAWNSCGS